MKMKPEHFQQMKEAFAVLDTEVLREAYRKGTFKRADAVKDLDKRYRWDLFYAAALPVQELYAYLNDDHIDTALRKLVKPL